MSDAIKKGDWVVDHTTTREGDLRIIAGHYPFAIRDHIGDILALVKSRSEARLGFTKASTLDERDEGWKIATLMAAAPELLAIVERFLESWETEESPNTIIIGDAIKVLRKARG